MKKFSIPMLLMLLSIVLTVFNVSPGAAQDEGPNFITPGAIPIQGRLTNASGTPLNGDYTLTFRLYEVAEGGSPICGQSHTVTIANGLFNSYLDNCYTVLTGQKVWLGIQVGSDSEMTPRQVILAVPYSLSLVPGAQIIDSIDGVLIVENSATSGDMDAFVATAGGTGEAITATADSGSGVFASSQSNSGVWAVSASSNHAALLAENDTGPAIEAVGTGIIRSSAPSYVWMSGNNAIKFQAGDSTIIDANGMGGATITRGATAGNKYIVFPVTITGPLYGQDVTISALELYWIGDTDFTSIINIRIRRQTAPNAYAEILFDDTDRICEDSVQPNGCTVHLNLTTNNVLTEESGILYIVVGLAFSGSTDWLQIGGLRLTLEHQ